VVQLQGAGQNPSHAIAVARCGYDLAIEPLACDQINSLIDFRARLAAAAEGAGQRPTADQLIQFGHMLFTFTVRRTIETIYNRLPNSHIRLHIYSNRPDLQALPWEYLQQPGTTPGPNSLRSVVRIVPTIGVEPQDPLKLDKALRMLFVYAEPVDQTAVAWLDIKESIEREFQVRLPDNFQLDLVQGATRQSLFDALDTKPYDVLNFAGHGELASDGTGHLLLKDFKTQKSDPISASQLGLLLRNKNLRLLMLSACSTSGGDFAKEFAVLAKTVVQSGVPAVVANQFPVTNSIAAKFAGAFYKELLRSGDVDQATTNGRIALAFEPPLPGGAARFEWGIPTVYRHVGAAQIFDRGSG